MEEKDLLFKEYKKHDEKIDKLKMFMFITNTFGKPSCEHIDLFCNEWLDDMKIGISLPEKSELEEYWRYIIESAQTKETRVYIHRVWGYTFYKLLNSKKNELNNILDKKITRADKLEAFKYFINNMKLDSIELGEEDEVSLIDALEKVEDKHNRIIGIHNKNNNTYTWCVYNELSKEITALNRLYKYTDDESITNEIFIDTNKEKILNHLLSNNETNIYMVSNELVNGLEVELIESIDNESNNKQNKEVNKIEEKKNTTQEVKPVTNVINNKELDGAESKNSFVANLLRTYTPAKPMETAKPVETDTIIPVKKKQPRRLPDTKVVFNKRFKLDLTPELIKTDYVGEYIVVKPDVYRDNNEFRIYKNGDIMIVAGAKTYKIGKCNDIVVERARTYRVNLELPISVDGAIDVDIIGNSVHELTTLIYGKPLTKNLFNEKGQPLAMYCDDASIDVLDGCRQFKLENQGYLDFIVGDCESVNIESKELGVKAILNIKNGKIVVVDKGKYIHLADEYKYIDHLLLYIYRYDDNLIAMHCKTNLLTELKKYLRKFEYTTEFDEIDNISNLYSKV